MRRYEHVLRGDNDVLKKTLDFEVIGKGGHAKGK